MMIGCSDYATELAAIRPWEDKAPAITDDERWQRIGNARKLMAEEGVDALIIGAGTSLRYFTGIRWGMIERLVALVLPLQGEPVIICPAFEEGSLTAEFSMDIRGCYWQEHESPYALIARVLAENQCAALAIDPSLPFGMAYELSRALTDVKISSASNIVDQCRRIKSPAEIAILQQAKLMTLEVQRRASRILKAGMKASEVCSFITEAHKAIGSDGTTFCIVQFGTSTAFPHGLPQDDVLAEGDMVLVDTGCLVEGYNSDITRSYVFGTPDAEQQRIWNIEKEAQLAVFDAARPGALCEVLDHAARTILEQHGLGPDYQLPGLPHRTGHGIGMTIHEPPYLVRGDKTPLQAGMCFSNEPMIVIPDRFGIRLEDHFYLTETGAQWFTEPALSITQPFGE